MEISTPTTLIFKKSPELEAAAAAWTPTPLLRVVALGVYAAAVTAFLFVLFYHWSYDDPFVTYRYAYNLKQGLGFVYNAGEPVLSTTSPLFAVLLALVGQVWSDLPRASNLIGALSLAGGALCLWDLSAVWKRPLVGYAALCLYPTFPLLLSTLGSEVPLYLAFGLGAVAAYARRRYHAVAFFAALALLTRADAVVVLVLVLAHYLARVRGRVPWTALLLFAALVLPWFLFAYAHFGSLVPATLAAKQHQGAMAASRPFWLGLLVLAQNYGTSPLYQIEALLAVLGLVLMLRRAHASALIPVWALLHLVLYTVLGVSSYFWYYAPVVPAFVVALGFGLSELPTLAARAVETAKSRFDTHKLSTRLRVGRTFTLPLAIRDYALVPIVILLALAVVQGQESWHVAQQSDNRSEIYTAVGEWLRANTPAAATVGTLDAGMIGYYAERRMVDFAGLLQPDVSEQLGSGKTFEDAAFWVVDRYRPEYLVLPDDWFPRLEEDKVWPNCWPIQYFPGDRFHYTTGINIYFCPQGVPGVQG